MTKVIEFHAQWYGHWRDTSSSTEFMDVRCGPCHMIAPIFQSLAKQYTNANFLKCDVDVAKDVASRYRITAM